MLLQMARALSTNSYLIIFPSLSSPDYNKYGKPLWVTEFACVDDSSSFIPCTDQGEINQYISDIVDLFESDSRVAAYAYSDGYGLGDVWPTTKNGKLSASGEAYLAALSRHH